MEVVVHINSEIERLKKLGYQYIVDNTTIIVDSETHHSHDVEFMVLTGISIINKNAYNNLSQYRIHLLSRTESRVVDLTNLDTAKGFIARGVLAVKVENMTSENLNISAALPINLTFIKISPINPIMYQTKHEPIKQQTTNITK